MDIKYTGQHIEVTPAIKAHADEKLIRLSQHGARIVAIDVSFHVEHLDQIAKATVFMPGKDIFAQHKSKDLYVSIDELAKKLMAQLDKC